MDPKTQGYMDYEELDKVQLDEWAKKDEKKKERTKVSIFLLALE